jgi:adenylate cyclase
MCVPLKVENRILGSVYVDTRKAGMRFTEEDLELFSTLASQSAMAIENARLAMQIVESEKRRQNLARFLPNALVDKVINESQTLVLGGQKTHVTSMFCDIRGSSELAEKLTPQLLVGLLNEHFSAMTEIVFKYEGTLDKYIGDEIMAIFGAPISVGDEPFRAVCTAIEMQRANAELNVLRGLENRPQFQVGTGIDTGEVIAGYIGSPKRMDFTVVGDRVNTAKRLCDIAGPGKTLIGKDVWEAVKDRVDAIPMGALMVKGKLQAVDAYEVVGLKR